MFHHLPPGEEDRGWRVWRDLRGGGPADAGQRGAEGGVGSAAQTGAQDGGRRAQEAPGWVVMDSVDLVTFLELIDPPWHCDLLIRSKRGYRAYHYHSWLKNVREVKRFLSIISPGLKETNNNNKKKNIGRGRPVQETAENARMTFVHR